MADGVPEVETPRATASEYQVPGEAVRPYFDRFITTCHDRFSVFANREDLLLPSGNKKSGPR
jgi:hypothetical protein